MTVMTRARKRMQREHDGDAHRDAAAEPTVTAPDGQATIQTRVTPTLPREVIAMIIDSHFQDADLTWWSAQRKEGLQPLQGVSRLIEHLVRPFKYETVNLYAVSLEELQFFVAHVLPVASPHVRKLHFVGSTVESLLWKPFEDFAAKHETHLSNEIVNLAAERATRTAAARKWNAEYTARLTTVINSCKHVIDYRVDPPDMQPYSKYAHAGFNPALSPRLHAHLDGRGLEALLFGSLSTTFYNVPFKTALTSFETLLNSHTDCVLLQHNLRCFVGLTRVTLELYDGLCNHVFVPLLPVLGSLKYLEELELLASLSKATSANGWPERLKVLKMYEPCLDLDVFVSWMSKLAGTLEELELEDAIFNTDNADWLTTMESTTRDMIPVRMPHLTCVLLSKTAGVGMWTNKLAHLIKPRAHTRPFYKNI
ncbi:hypothetical protein ACM66B_000640 [Microbotryomycetes sp. NB124-2]